MCFSVASCQSGKGYRSLKEIAVQCAVISFHMGTNILSVDKSCAVFLFKPCFRQECHLAGHSDRLCWDWSSLSLLAAKAHEIKKEQLFLLHTPFLLPLFSDFHISLEDEIEKGVLYLMKKSDNQKSRKIVLCVVRFF